MLLLCHTTGWYPSSLRKVKVKLSHYRPTGFQEVKAPRILDNRHMKVVGFQPYAPAAFIPRIILVLVFRG